MLEKTLVDKSHSVDKKSNLSRKLSLQSERGPFKVLYSLISAHWLKFDFLTNMLRQDAHGQRGLWSLTTIINFVRCTYFSVGGLVKITDL